MKKKQSNKTTLQTENRKDKRSRETRNTKIKSQNHITLIPIRKSLNQKRKRKMK